MTSSKESLGFFRWCSSLHVSRLIRMFTESCAIRLHCTRTHIYTNPLTAVTHCLLCGGVGLCATRVCTHTMGDEDTTIRIKRTTWERLNRRKEPGKSFDEIINGVLDRAEESATAPN